MNRTVGKGLLLAIVHVAMVASLGAKLLIDRAEYPRVWARAAPVDPNLPIRGRYVRLRLEAAVGPGLELSLPGPVASGTRTFTQPAPSRPVVLSAEDGALVARPTSQEMDALLAHARQRDGRIVAELETPVAYFIPENAPDPSRRPDGEELWVEVTIPPHGAPRPIRIGVKKGGILTALDLR